VHTQSSASETGKGRVFDGVTPYHWLVVIIASCGWLFDCMDQRLFILARESALRELLAGDPQIAQSIKTLSGYATTSMILGWATGGIIFGMMSDRLGRVKTMMVTLVIYSGFTGIPGLAQSCGLHDLPVSSASASAEFGAATTLVAESVPAAFPRHGAGCSRRCRPWEHHRLALRACHSA
jgi:MFS family permease